ncbi:Protein BONZAI 3 [Linum perenne]
MGGCMSGDVKGGKQAIGGGSHLVPQPSDNNNDGGHNDAVDFFFRSHGLHPLFSQIELSLSASKLLDRDVTSKSDPMAVLYAKKHDGKLEEVGRTEVILNTLNPSWISKVTISYQFEMLQPLVIQVYDVDTRYHNVPVKSLDLKDQDFLGEANCFLSEIVTKQNRTLILSLQNKSGHGVVRNLGTVSIHAEETVASKTAVEIAFRCSHLDNKDMFSLSVRMTELPFMTFLCVRSNLHAPSHAGSFLKNIQNSGEWRFYTNMQDRRDTQQSKSCLETPMSNNAALRKQVKFINILLQENPLVIECLDFNSNGNHTLIGKIQKSISDLEILYREKAGVNLTSPHHGREKVLKGQLFVDHFVEKEQFSFLDYISSGYELNFMVAVDFTASNGNPRLPDSLHYIDPAGRLNSYQKAIMEVGEVIQFYDSDKRFPAWGFGGRTPDGVVSHCFNLNGGPSGLEVDGVEGIMSAYATSLHNVSLAGPTLFGRVITNAAEIAAQSLSQDHRKYYVLLIITDGVLTDFQETKDAVVLASDLPLSILIVGVGNADFTQMEILDADNGRRLESSTGRVATRDIVQFVPMREVHSGRLSAVQALLEELPGQFLTYVRSRDLKPVPRQQ